MKGVAKLLPSGKTGIFAYFLVICHHCQLSIPGPFDHPGMALTKRWQFRLSSEGRWQWLPPEACHDLTVAARSNGAEATLSLLSLNMTVNLSTLKMLMDGNILGDVRQAGQVTG